MTISTYYIWASIAKTARAKVGQRIELELEKKQFQTSNYTVRVKFKWPVYKSAKYTENILTYYIIATYESVFSGDIIIVNIARILA